MSICTRCGKERVVKSSYTEKLEKTTVFYTVTVCPDPECQKVVEMGLLVEEGRRKTMNDEKERRVQALASRRRGNKLASTN